MMLRIENGKRLKKDVKIQFRERCLETYRTYRKFNTIHKTFANRLYVNSTSIRNLSRQPKSNREKNAVRIKRVIDTCLDDLDRINYPELSLS